MRIPVVDTNNQPLMPTTPARARRWVESGKAVKRWSDCGQFYVQLRVEPSGRGKQDIVIGLDAGKKYSGIGVQSAKFTLYSAHLVLPFQVVRDRMDARRMMRKCRRGRRINRRVEFSRRAHRQQRFSNRKGGLAPSIRASRQLEMRVVSELCKIFPVSEIRYEYVKADVDLTSGRKNARSGRGFSAIMVGQRWLIEQLNRFAPVITIFGYQTSLIRAHLGLAKNKEDKSKPCFETHAVDGVAIASSHFVGYEKYHKKGEDGARWRGSATITKALFFVIRRPAFSRRQLHMMSPKKGGGRRRHGGSTTRYGFRKGDLVNSPKGMGYISGDTDRKVSVSDTDWKRLGRIAPSRVQLIRRSNGLTVNSKLNQK